MNYFKLLNKFTNIFHIGLMTTIILHNHLLMSKVL